MAYLLFFTITFFSLWEVEVEVEVCIIPQGGREESGVRSMHHSGVIHKEWISNVHKIYPNLILFLLYLPMNPSSTCLD